MFFRMIRGAFTRQWKKMLMIALTIALGASLATAMLNVMLDVGDKVNQELKAYGANITVVPKAQSVLDTLYEVEDGGAADTAYLREDELGRIKTIFWAFNIVDFSPFLDTAVSLPSGGETKVVGMWFNHHLALPTGEELDTGVKNLRTWWSLDEGAWLDEQTEPDHNAAMVGAALARRENIRAGDVLRVTGGEGSAELRVVGVFDSGDDADSLIYAPLSVAQSLSGREGLLTSIEVSALTTPDNELAERAAKDPGSLSIAQYELWYCTAYVSSICYQIQEVINYPEIVLADEPTGNLDEANENIVLDIFRQLHRDGTTLIVVTHDPEVGEVAQRTVTLEHGRIARDAQNADFREA